MMQYHVTGWCGTVHLLSHLDELCVLLDDSTHVPSSLGHIPLNPTSKPNVVISVDIHLLIWEVKGEDHKKGRSSV